MSETQEITAATIAEDVIKLMDAKKANAQSGIYFRSKEAQDSGLKGAIESHGFRCDVCALGGLFVGLVFRANAATVGQSMDDDFMRARLLPYFDETQQSLIESAFEREWMGCADEDDAEAAAAFGDRFDDDDARLRAICESIIANGKFAPPPA